MPQTTEVFPILTTADPSAVCIELRFSDASRKFINSLPSLLLLRALKQKLFKLFNIYIYE